MLEQVATGPRAGARVQRLGGRVKAEHRPRKAAPLGPGMGAIQTITSIQGMALRNHWQLDCSSYLRYSVPNWTCCGRHARYERTIDKPEPDPQAACLQGSLMKFTSILSKWVAFKSISPELPIAAANNFVPNLGPAEVDLLQAERPGTGRKLSVAASPDIMAREAAAIQIARAAKATKQNAKLERKKAERNQRIHFQYRREVYGALRCLEKQDADIKSMMRTMKALDGADDSPLARIYPRSVQACGVALTQRGFRRIMTNEAGRQAVSKGKEWMLENNLSVDPRKSVATEVLRVVDALKGEFHRNNPQPRLEWF